MHRRGRDGGNNLRGGRRLRGGPKRLTPRLPKDPAKAKETLDEQLVKFQQKRGINSDEYEKQKKLKLDSQLRDFMEKSKSAAEQTGEPAAASSRVVEEK